MMRRLWVTCFLFLISAHCAADPSRWVEVVGGSWTPTPALLSEIEAALKAAVPKAAYRGDPLPPWSSYTFQFQGARLPDGRRVVYVNALCKMPDYRPDPRTEFIGRVDGGPCYFVATYDVEPKQLLDLFVNGTA